MTIINNLKSRTWAEINLFNLEKNYIELRNRVPKSAKVCCVVKADAYGHGAIQVARCLENAGADFFAVSNIDEALQLRNANIVSPILILGYTPPKRVFELAQNNISQCIYSSEYAKAVAKEARAKKLTVSVHIKIDAGMGRLGFVCRHGEAIDEIAEVCGYSCFSVDGIFTHFPTADGGEKSEEITHTQYDIFLKTVKALEGRGISFKLRHCANSATAIDYPEYSLDMVRVGIALYGVLPSENLKNKLRLYDTVALKTVISNIKTARAGDSIGYGADYVAEHPITVATLPIGYADGFRRINYINQTKLCVNGRMCDIVGRVCMDQVMIDVSGIEGLRVGDEVTVFGDNQGTALSDFAKKNETIPYEILCSIGARVPRLYRLEEDGELV